MGKPPRERRLIHQAHGVASGNPRGVRRLRPRRAVGLPPRVHREDRERYARIDEPERSLAWFDDGRIVAATGVYTRQLTVPGAVVPCAAVTAVGVVPTHRRRGLLTAMMRRQLEDVRERGDPVASAVGVGGRRSTGASATGSRRDRRASSLAGPRRGSRRRRRPVSRCARGRRASTSKRCARSTSASAAAARGCSTAGAVVGRSACTTRSPSATARSRCRPSLVARRLRALRGALGPRRGRAGRRGARSASSSRRRRPRTPCCGPSCSTRT